MQLNTKLNKILKPHGHAHLSAWCCYVMLRALFKIFCKYGFHYWIYRYKVITKPYWTDAETPYNKATLVTDTFDDRTCKWCKKHQKLAHTKFVDPRERNRTGKRCYYVYNNYSMFDSKKLS